LGGKQREGKGKGVRRMEVKKREERRERRYEGTGGEEHAYRQLI